MTVGYWQAIMKVEMPLVLILLLDFDILVWVQLMNYKQKNIFFWINIFFKKNQLKTEQQFHLRNCLLLATRWSNVGKEPIRRWTNLFIFLLDYIVKKKRRVLKTFFFSLSDKLHIVWFWSHIYLFAYLDVSSNDITDDICDIIQSETNKYCILFPTKPQYYTSILFFYRYTKQQKQD
jgi:hypothetical protein